MNKAFVREDNDREPRCPVPEGCGGRGVSVPGDTVAAQVTGESHLSVDVFYCDDPACKVGYFDPWGATVLASALTALCWPKDPSAPLCPCFGLTDADVVEDARLRDPSRLRELIKKSEGPEAACATCRPDGQSCIVDARRLFMRHLEPESQE